MYPSFNNTTFQLPSPHYITLDNDNMIFNELLQQENLFYDDHINHNNANNISVHQKLSSPNIRASLQSAMGKCSNNNGDDGFNKPKSSSKRRRASKTKTDRHNKINTTQGPRDRRMRLSIEVSKKFFKLQDMLGFDKASKTVEWLLMKSKSNIQQLMIPHGKSSFSKGESSASRCQLLAEYLDGDQSAKCCARSSRKGKKKIRRGVRTIVRPLAKETREMARKRARERTLEKSSKLGCVSGGGDDQFSKFEPCLDQTMDQGVNCFESWIVNQPEQTLQNKEVLGNNWNPSFLFDYQQTGVLHPHEVINNVFSTQPYPKFVLQHDRFQILGSLWEVKN